MTCPACGNLVPGDPVVRNVTICACLVSLVIEGGACRRATGDDTGALDERELAALRKRRKQLREAA